MKYIHILIPEAFAFIEYIETNWKTPYKKNNMSEYIVGPFSTINIYIFRRPPSIDWDSNVLRKPTQYFTGFPILHHIHLSFHITPWPSLVPFCTIERVNKQDLSRYSPAPRRPLALWLAGCPPDSAYLWAAQLPWSASFLWSLCFVPVRRVA